MDYQIHRVAVLGAGMMGADLTAAAQAHLATCQQCQVVLNTTQQVILLGHGQRQQAIPTPDADACLLVYKPPFLPIILKSERLW